MAFAPLLLLFSPGLILLGLGLQYATASLDTLWQRQERTLMAQGIEAQRTPAWEKRIRSLGRFYVALAVILLAFAGYAAVVSQPSQMSGVRIDGRELTKAEWDACGRDALRCTIIEMNTRHIRR